MKTLKVIAMLVFLTACENVSAPTEDTTRAGDCSDLVGAVDGAWEYAQEVEAHRDTLQAELDTVNRMLSDANEKICTLESIPTGLASDDTVRKTELTRCEGDRLGLEKELGYCREEVEQVTSSYEYYFEHYNDCVALAVVP